MCNKFYSIKAKKKEESCKNFPQKSRLLHWFFFLFLTKIKIEKDKKLTFEIINISSEGENPPLNATNNYLNKNR